MLRKIIIQVAMIDEAIPIVDELQLEEVILHGFDANTFRCFKKTIENNKIYLVCNTEDGVGPKNSADLTLDILYKLNPDLIINAGTAGGLDSQVGDVYLGTHSLFHDESYQEISLQNQEVHRYDALQTSLISEIVGLRTGTITTGANIELQDGEFENIQHSGALMKDMEAAAISAIAKNRCPVVFIKAISDLVREDYDSTDEFLSNLTLSMNNLAKKIHEIIVCILNKTANQLHYDISMLNPECIYEITKNVRDKLNNTVLSTAYAFDFCLYNESHKKKIRLLDDLLVSLSSIKRSSDIDEIKVRDMLKAIYTSPSFLSTQINKIIHKFSCYQVNLIEDEKDNYNTSVDRSLIMLCK